MAFRGAKWFLYFLPAILASFALATSALFSFRCESVQFTPIGTTDENDDDEPLPNLQFGPWYQKSVQVTQLNIGGQPRILIRDVCVSYPSYNAVDAKWKTVRAFGIMSLFVGGLLTFWLWLTPCATNFREMPTQSWNTAAVCFFCFLLTLFQGLTFLLFESNLCLNNSVLNGNNSDNELQSLYSDTCSWAPGSTANVLSTVFWFLTGIVMVGMGPPRAPPRGPPETQEVTYERKVQADGTTVVAETAVIKGTALPTSSPPPPTLQDIHEQTGEQP